MPASATNSMIAGMYYAWLARRDSNGYPMGALATPDSPVATTVYGAYRIKHPVSVTDPKITRLIATRKGGQAIRGRRALGVDQFGDFELVLDAFDETLHAMITNALVDTTTVSGIAATSMNANLSTLPRWVLGVMVGAETEGGVDQFFTVVYNNVQITAPWLGASQQGGDNPNPLTYTITPDSSQRTVTGDLYSATGLSVVDNSDISTVYRYDYPLYVATFVADGILTTFTLPYKPVNSDATGNTINSHTKNGTHAAVTSVNTTSGLVTLTAPGTAADKHVMFVPVNTNWS